MYEDGSGVPRDYQLAAKWYAAAAEHGDARARYNLANLYSSGRGVPLDYVSAYEWYKLAAAGGEGLAIRKLRDVSELMTSRQKQLAVSRLLERQNLIVANAKDRSLFVSLYSVEQ